MKHVIKNFRCWILLAVQAVVSSASWKWHHPHVNHIVTLTTLLPVEERQWLFKILIKNKQFEWNLLLHTFLCRGRNDSEQITMEMLTGFRMFLLQLLILPYHADQWYLEHKSIWISGQVQLPMAYLSSWWRNQKDHY